MSVHIAMATEDETPECARMLAEAFHDDPVVRRIVPGDRDRVRRLALMFTAELRAGAMACGVVDVARATPGGAIVGVAAWEGPHHGLAGWRQVRALPDYLRAIGLRDYPASRRVLRVFAEHRPDFRHWYLADIAVSPAARGLGVGSALLDYRLSAVDAQAIPAYLEATTPGSQRLYERYGFVATSTIELGDGVAATGMVRRP